MNRFLKTLLLLFAVMLLGSFDGPVDNKFLLTGGTEKKWRLEYFLFDGYDFTDSVECMRGIDVTFYQNGSYSSNSPCESGNIPGEYSITEDKIILNSDTFLLEEITENKLKYSYQKKVMATIGGEDLVEIPHRFTYLLYAQHGN